MLVKKIKNDNWKLNFEKISIQTTEENNKKSKFIEDILNKMYFALFENIESWNHIRLDIIEDLNEVLKKIRGFFRDEEQSFANNNFNFSGFQDNADFQNKNLNAFFTLANLQNQITLNFHKHKAAKSEIVDYFIAIANKNSIFEDEVISEFLMKNKVETWKRQLYEWIGEKIILKQEEIKVVLERFEFINLETKTQYSYIAWFKYFDKFDSIPVKILIRKENTNEKNLKNYNDSENWYLLFLKSVVPVVIAFIFLFIFIVINFRGAWLWLKLRNILSIVSSAGSWQSIAAEDCLLELGDYLGDNISNDFQDNVVAISDGEPSLITQFLNKVFSKFSSLKKVAFFGSTKFLDKNLERRFDLSDEFAKWDSKFDDIFDNPVIVEHNFDSFKWGVFDVIRYGRFKIANCDYEFLFKIERKNFQQPPQTLVNQFYEKIWKIFRKIYISKKNINIENVLAMASKIIIDILHAQSSLKISNNWYFFSPDSFWLEAVELEDHFIKLNLRHLLFFDPLMIKINFISTGDESDQADD